MTCSEQRPSKAELLNAQTFWNGQLRIHVQAKPGFKSIPYLIRPLSLLFSSLTLFLSLLSLSTLSLTHSQSPSFSLSLSIHYFYLLTSLPPSPVFFFFSSLLYFCFINSFVLLFIFSDTTFGAKTTTTWWMFRSGCSGKGWSQRRMESIYNKFRQFLFRAIFQLEWHRKGSGSETSAIYSAA